AEVPKIYMHQFWNTIKKIKDTDAYQFKLDKQKFCIDTKVFREILQICPGLPNKDFVEPPSDEEMVPFIKDLGYTSKCDMLFEIHTDRMHQPWRTFAIVINRDIIFSCKENIPCPGFTKVIINHFISKDKTIYTRNKINLHTIRDDSLLGTLKYVSKIEDYQKYGALILEQVINQAIQDSKEYKIYLAFATREATTKKSKKFKKIASPSRKQTLVLEEEPTEKPKRAKHLEPAKESAPAKRYVSSKKPSRRQSTAVQIKDTPCVFMSKKKTPATTDRSKDTDFLSEAALLEDSQMKKVFKRSKKETYFHQSSGSGDRVGSQPKVYDELQDKEVGTNEGVGTIPRVPDVPKDQSESENNSWGESRDDDDSNDDDTLSGVVTSMV
nr:hypothetical protein [Tanacetum cinerariifolium]